MENKTEIAIDYTERGIELLGVRHYKESYYTLELYAIKDSDRYMVDLIWRFPDSYKLRVTAWLGTFEYYRQKTLNILEWPLPQQVYCVLRDLFNSDNLCFVNLPDAGIRVSHIINGNIYELRKCATLDTNSIFDNVTEEDSEGKEEPTHILQNCVAEVVSENLNACAADLESCSTEPRIKNLKAGMTEIEKMVLNKGEETKLEHWESLYKRIKEIQEAKSADYTGGRDPHWNFSKSLNINLPVWKGILIRMQDKLSRLESFACTDTFKVKDESFEDTCLDLANYALILATAKHFEGK